METAIYRDNSHWEKPYLDLFKRDIVNTLIDRMHLRQIEVIKGIRRAGKTTVCKLLINEIIKGSRLLPDPTFPLFVTNHLAMGIC